MKQAPAAGRSVLSVVGGLDEETGVTIEYGSAHSKRGIVLCTSVASGTEVGNIMTDPWLGFDVSAAADDDSPDV